jgi:hypothetical protein
MKMAAPAPRTKVARGAIEVATEDAIGPPAEVLPSRTMAAAQRA